ncbi:MAG: hypothetical protein WAL45_04380 [Terracidiphilus sp.]
MRQVSLFFLFICSAYAVALHSQIQAQQASPVNVPDSNVRRFEIGGQFTDLILGESNEYGVPKFAFGPTAGFNLNRHLALDSSYVLMNTPSGLFPSSGGRASVFVGGVRAEARAKHYGLFAYGRPGVLHYAAYTVTEPTAGFTTTTFSNPGTSHFVTNVGGGVEYFGPYRVRTRVELGDLLEYHPCPLCVIQNWTNHLQFSVGMYAAMGKPVAGKPFDTDSGRSHSFFDRTNLLLFGTSLLGQSADAITTQRSLSHGGAEGDPLARPFVDQGWGGQVGAAVVENTSQIFVMYLLHKMGHHRVEKTVPLADAFVHGYEGYHNLQHR